MGLSNGYHIHFSQQQPPPTATPPSPMASARKVFYPLRTAFTIENKIDPYLIELYFSQTWQIIHCTHYHPNLYNSIQELIPWMIRWSMEGIRSQTLKNDECIGHATKWHKITKLLLVVLTYWESRLPVLRSFAHPKTSNARHALPKRAIAAPSALSLSLCSRTRAGIPTYRIRNIANGELVLAQQQSI